MQATYAKKVMSYVFMLYFCLRHYQAEKMFGTLSSSKGKSQNVPYFFNKLTWVSELSVNAMTEICIR